jgi:hypothetical protein
MTIRDRIIELPDDPEEAVRRLRAELRRARRRLAAARRASGFAAYRRLPLVRPTSFADRDPGPAR